MIWPAVAVAEIRMRAAPPSSTPIRTSVVTCSAMPNAVVAGSGTRPASAGADADRQRQREARAGCAPAPPVSPKPGSSMIIAPVRANSSAVAQISTP